ncbi:hypothetical protein KWB77_003516 [Vibrio cholerae]|uniref:hypothetical protein n=1 Tax=Vibrio kanaloae TaxID=170673 RepID=UPI001F4328ED|nr:hypothetical protein [Vibrio kanaloae]EHS7465869.1 hypothetical protein [Vibrio cholerae]UIJ43087.1 hypothetical protein LWM38_15695 [Vibrio kanaloae]
MKIIQRFKQIRFEITASGLCAVLALLVSFGQLIAGSPLYIDYYSKPRVVVEQVRHKDESSSSSVFFVYNQGNSVIKNFTLEIGALNEASVIVLGEPRSANVREEPLTIEGHPFDLGKRVTVTVPTLYKDESFSVTVRSELVHIKTHEKKSIWGLYSPLPAVMFAVHEDGYAVLDASTYSLNKKP